MRKYLLAYCVWNKQDMISWLLDGIVENIDPTRCDLLFMFTNCTDKSEENFKANTSKLIRFKWDSFSWLGDDAWELDQHNVLLKWFLEKSDCNVLIVPQDDNRINGKTLLDDLDKVFDVHGNHLGVVGGRDGYDCGYKNMVGSAFSVSAGKTRSLAIGEFAARLMSNTGPRVYPRALAMTNDFHDETNKIYSMDDYCLRANHNYGFVNGVMGMDIRHEKFGKTTETVFREGQVARDLAALNARWTPILGHNVF